MTYLKSERAQLMEENAKLRGLLHVGVMLVEATLRDTPLSYDAAGKWIEDVVKFGRSVHYPPRPTLVDEARPCATDRAQRNWSPL